MCGSRCNRLAVEDLQCSVNYLFFFECCWEKIKFFNTESQKDHHSSTFIIIKCNQTGLRIWFIFGQIRIPPIIKTVRKYLIYCHKTHISSHLFIQIVLPEKIKKFSQKSLKFFKLCSRFYNFTVLG